MLSRDQLNFGSPCQYSQQKSDDLEINGPNSIFPLRLSNKCNGQIIQKTCNIWTLFTIKTIIRISIYIILYYSELWFVFYNHFFDDNHVLLRTYLKWKEVNKAAKISEIFRKSEKKLSSDVYVQFWIEKCVKTSQFVLNYPVKMSHISSMDAEDVYKTPHPRDRGQRVKDFLTRYSNFRRRL